MIRNKSTKKCYLRYNEHSDSRNNSIFNDSEHRTETKTKSKSKSKSKTKTKKMSNINKYLYCMECSASQDLTQVVQKKNCYIFPIIRMVIFDTANSSKHINIFYESHDILTPCLLLRPEEIEDSDINYCNCAK